MVSLTAAGWDVDSRSALAKLSKVVQALEAFSSNVLVFQLPNDLENVNLKFEFSHIVSPAQFVMFPSPGITPEHSGGCHLGLMIGNAVKIVKTVSWSGQELNTGVPTPPAGHHARIFRLIITFIRGVRFTQLHDYCRVQRRWRTDSLLGHQLPEINVHE